MKWLKASDVTEPGSYVLNRVDDGDQASHSILRINIINRKARYFNIDTFHDLALWDEECRFFGPIPPVE